MSAVLTLPVAGPAHKPDSRKLLPLDLYDYILVSFSGGKDSLALVLDLLEQGVPPERIQLWHQDIDGVAGVDEVFFDWPCTRSYVQAVGDALGIRVLFQAREGGFKGELMKEEARTLPIIFDRQDGTTGHAGGTLASKIGTRRRFPQKTGNLAVRWCSAILKIDVFALAVNNEPMFKKDKRLLVLTGERREESTNRATYAEKEPHRCDGKARRVDAWRSVIDWNEARVWEIIRRWGIVPHPAYRLGFPRVSCMACIFGQADQWASVRLLSPDLFDRIACLEMEFGATITRGKTVVQMADKGTPYPACHDAALASLAMGHAYPADAVRVAPEAWEMPAGAFRQGGGPI